MNNKKLVETLCTLLLPKFQCLELKCDRIIAELSELKNTLSPTGRDIDTLIDKLEDSANEMFRQSLACRCSLEEQTDINPSVFTLKIVEKDGFQQ